MELSYIWVLMVVVVIAVLGWKWRQKSAHAHNKGEQGEAMLRQHTDPSLADKGYHALHDLLIPLYESTTQIDHLYVSRYGIFVVETKNYAGWIYGDAEQKQWTQVLYQQKYRFYNPLKQNETHIKALAYLLKLPMDKFHSIVVFVGEAELKTALPDNVLQGADISGYVRRFRRSLLSQAQVDEIYATLSHKRYRATAAKKRRHVRDVQGRHG